MTRAAFDLWLVKALGATAEHRFHGTRKWRLDFAWPSVKLAVEVDGGTWARGRHVTGAGYREDCIKGNEAIILGWRVLHVTTDMIKDGTAADQVERALRDAAATKINARRRT